MANVLKPKRSATAAKVPTTTDLASGELGVNMADRKIYINNGTAVVQVGAGLLSALGDVNMTGLATGNSISWNGTQFVPSAAGSGTVTSVALSGGTTGLTTSGGPITTSGTITLAGTLAIANGGTGATTAAGALTALGAYAASNPSGFITSSGSITGSARLSEIQDTRAAQILPSGYSSYRAMYEFTNQITGDWVSGVSFTGWTAGTYASWQLLGPSSTSAPETFYLRSGIGSTWNSLRTILHSGNFNSYAPTLTGTGASGSWGISITGSAASITGTYGGTLTSSQITTGLGFTPYNSTNPSGYITSAGTAANVSGTVAIANGGTGATTAAAARTNLGATTLGSNLFTLANVAAISFPRINADNSVSALDAATFRTAIGAGTSSTTGTVTGITAGTGLSGGTIVTSGTIALANTTVTAGSYTNASITVDAQGRITAASSGSAGGVTSFNTRTGAVTLTSSDVTTALGYTPYNATNPNGYITSSGSISGNAGTVTNGVYTTSAVLLDKGGASSAVDWNTLTTAGIYSIGAASFTGANTPSSAYPYGQLVISTNGNIVVQQYYTHTSPVTIWTRAKYNAADWQPWSVGVNSGNFTNYSPSLTGSGASGTWGISVSGNAATATAASTIVVANDTTTNALVYPLWATGTSSGTAAKISSSSLSFNPSTGTLNATLHLGLTSSTTGGVPIIARNTSSANNTTKAVALGLQATDTVGTVKDVAAIYATPVTADYIAATMSFWVRSSDSMVSRATLDGSGNFTANGNVTAYSDERLKTDWADLAHDFVERLAVVKSGLYTRIDNGLRQIGVSAQSLEGVAAEGVLRDAQGNLSVAYGNVALAAAVALSQRVIQLEARLKELELKAA